MTKMRLLPFIIIAVCLLVLMTSCASPQPEPPPAPSPPPPLPQNEDAAKLARRFCPVIYLKGEGDIIESYEPTQIQILIDQAVVRDIQDPSFSEKATLSGLLQWSNSSYYLDIVGLDPSIKSFDEYQHNYEEVKSKYQPTLYARVIENPDQGYTIVQYWIFYYFNDWRNFHEGDWELVQLHFPGKTAGELLETGEPPVLAAYSQHQSGQQMSWNQMIDAGLVEETHPKVYVAQGSHANYFTPGNFWAGLDFDDTGLSSWHIVRPQQVNISQLPEMIVEKEAPEWLEFKGYWGEYTGFSILVFDLRFWQRGPFGPPWSEAENLNQRWERPHEWATRLPEYPSPFWTGFFKLPGDWSKLAVFSLFSPADLHVYDTQGRHAGIDETGKPETNIPGSIYLTPEGTDYKTILITDADVSYEYSIVVKGKESGTMDLRAQVPELPTRLKRFLEYLSVPISAKTTARTTIKPEMRMMAPRIAAEPGETMRDTTTKLEIDYDGDGVFETESMPGKFEE